VALRLLRIAIFGGTFDPVHNAHIAVAVAARNRYALDRVLLVPAANPPHKDAGVTESFEHRYRMLELACKDIPGLEPSRLEAGVETSYSVLTIERVRQTLASNDSLYFLIGADAFAEVRTWFRWRDVLQAVEFIVVSRPGHDFDIPEGAIVHPLENVSLEVSSSEIRERLAQGCRTPDLPNPVFDYISSHKLYDFGTLAKSHSPD
jgi:nicotinate-nucleotide adenylyltransferase